MKIINVTSVRTVDNQKNKLIEAGKQPTWQVTPPHIIDLELAKKNIVRTLEYLFASYEKDIAIHYNMYLIIFTSAFFSFKYLPTPEIVPPVPIPATKISTVPSVSCQISFAVV